jgi:hypothetical protein
MEHTYVALERMMLVPGVANVVNRRLADIKSASDIIDEVAQVLETIDYIYDDNILVDDPDLEMPEDIANLPPVGVPLITERDGTMKSLTRSQRSHRQTIQHGSPPTYLRLRSYSEALLVV